MCMQDVALSRSGKSRALTSAQGNLGLPAVAKQTRRLFGPCGGAVRQDVLAAAGWDAASGEGTDFEVWVAHRKAKKKGGEQKG